MRKRTTKKTGNFTKSTKTLSSKRGLTQSNSFRAPNGSTRRTVSHNNGKMRTTQTIHHGNGWSTTRSKTITLIGKSKTQKVKNYNSNHHLIDTDVSWWNAIKSIITYAFLWMGMFIGLIVLSIIFILIME